MNKITFYEQAGIVIPGSVFVFGLLFFFPAIQTVLTKDGVSLGDLGIFVLLSYAAGQLIAAIGNIGEIWFWRLFGCMPTDWITRTSTTLLSSSLWTASIARGPSANGLLYNRASPGLGHI